MFGKNLAAVKDQTDQLLEQRHSKAADSYEAALSAFRLAAERDFREPEAVAEAGRQLSQAIRFHPRRAEPYAAMAYLLYLFGKQSDAQACLRTALKLEPGLELALRLQQLFQDAASRPAASGQEPSAVRLQPMQARPAPRPAQTQRDLQDLPDAGLPSPPAQLERAAGPAQGQADVGLANHAPADQDGLDITPEQIEALIRKVVRDMLHQPTFKASVQPAEIAALQGFQGELQQTYATVCGQIKALEADFETAHLRLKLKPLEMRLAQFDKLLRVSQDFLQLNRDIAGHLQQVNQEIARLDQLDSGEQIPVVRARLESLLDGCDIAADRLDAWERTGYDISPVKISYDQLLERVEDLQDQLEDTLERLGL